MPSKWRTTSKRLNSLRVLMVRVGSALTLVSASGCSSEPPPSISIPSADAQNGRRLIEQLGCGTCHVIPGVPGAKGTVGPPLEHFARRVYVAGKFPNEPEWLVRFIRDPPALEPRTAMPALGLTEGDARDIAAYLYELR